MNDFYQGKAYYVAKRNEMKATEDCVNLTRSK